MPHLRRTGSAARASLVVSLAGVALVAAALSQPRPVPSGSAGLHVWALFSTLCLLGALATLFPHLCGRLDRRPETLGPSRTSTLLGVRVVHGHHPRCGEFDGHEFAVNGKTLCAGCSGLLVGASTAVVVATHHFVLGVHYPAVTAFVGLGCVAVGLLHLRLLRAGGPVLRFALNAALVMGFALVLVGVDSVRGPGFDLVVIGLCVFWMFTRIQLSSWDHERICYSCGYRCEKGATALRGRSR